MALMVLVLVGQQLFQHSIRAILLRLAEEEYTRNQLNLKDGEKANLSHGTEIGLEILR